MATRFNDDVTFAGGVTFSSTIAAPSASIAASAISDTAADLAASKVQQQRVWTAPLGSGNPATGAYYMGSANTALTIKRGRAICYTKPASGTLTIDIVKSTAGTTASVLSSTVTFTSSSSDKTFSSDFTFSTTSLSANDAVWASITAGTGAAGVGVELCIEEGPYT